MWQNTRWQKQQSSSSVGLDAPSGPIQHRVELVADGGDLVIPGQLGFCIGIKSDAALHLVDDGLRNQSDVSILSPGSRVRYVLDGQGVGALKPFIRVPSQMIGVLGKFRQAGLMHQYQK